MRATSNQHPRRKEIQIPSRLRMLWLLSSALAVCCVLRCDGLATSTNGSTKLDLRLFQGALPKEEIGALRFLREHPEYDGRGTVIAVLDTGVDPGAAGLQVTTDGKPKIIDVVDGTGAGDVDTSRIVRAGSDWVIIGCSGKELKVNATWNNPTGEWHTGCKRLYGLLPQNAIKRLKRQYRQSFNAVNNVALTNTREELLQLKEQRRGIGQSPQKRRILELESRVDLLQNGQATFRDPDPILDCVVWHDGKNWKAALDTSEIQSVEGKSSFADFIPMTSFKIERQYSTFSVFDAVNYAVNIYDNGNILSIVTTADPHGTHVAGIAAAYHPDDPLLNGVAPGAQIVSCITQDKRNNEEENFKGFRRCAINAMANEVDLINFSVARSRTHPNGGPWADVSTRLVRDSNIVFVAATGNSGPALSTILTPASYDDVIAVGAYLSPSLAASGEVIRKDLPKGKPYYFTSIGPAADGALGTNFAAPGGAVSVVPQWTTGKKQMFRGTSMASPNACGGIALLISGMKDINASITSRRLQRAIENTCIPIGAGDAESILAQGQGLFQVDRAWEYLRQEEDMDESFMSYAVEVHRLDGGPPQRGIYLRENSNTDNSSTFRVNVRYEAAKNTKLGLDGAEHKKQFSLSCTELWVECPNVFMLEGVTNEFEITVDPSGLREGLHYAEVQGFDTMAVWKGPLFRVPVTVIRLKEPQTNNSSTRDAAEFFNTKLGPFQLSEGHPIREFLAIPDGATVADIALQFGGQTDAKLYIIQLQHTVPFTTNTRFANSTFKVFHGGETVFKDQDIVSGFPLEIAMVQEDNSVGASSVTMDIQFHGARFSDRELHLDGPEGIGAIQVTSVFRPEDIQLSAKFDTLCIPLHPKASKIGNSTDPRDLMPGQDLLYVLTLTYELEMTEASSIALSFPMITSDVSDHDVEDFVFNIYGKNWKFIKWGLEKANDANEANLEVGNYVILVQVQHEEPIVVEKLKNMQMIVKVQTNISVPVHPEFISSIQSGIGFNEEGLNPGESIMIVVGPVRQRIPTKILRDRPGSILNGTLNLVRTPERFQFPLDSIPLSYTVPTLTDMAATDSKERRYHMSIQDHVQKAGLEAQIKTIEEFNLTTVEDWEDFSTLVGNLTSNLERDTLRLATASLKKLNGLEKEDRRGQLELVSAISEDVIAAIDMKQPFTPAEPRIKRDGTGLRRLKKEGLVEALVAKLTSIMDIEELSGSRRRGEQENINADDDTIDQVFDRLSRLVNTTEAKYSILRARHAAQGGRYATAIKALKPTMYKSREALDLALDYVEELGWSHFEICFRSTRSELFPSYVEVL